MELIETIILISIVVVTFYGILLIRSLEFMSVRELKRQARNGNSDAAKVYPVRAYGMQLWILMWTILGFLTTSIILILKALIGSPVLIILINVPLIVILHAILPWSKRPKPSLHMAALASPYLEFVLRKTFPVMHRLEKWVGRWIQPEPFMLIQSKDELLEIIRHNADDFDRISKHELAIAENALLFGEKLVQDHMVPLNSVFFVNATDDLTPVLVGELHDSGHSRFPVFRDSNQNVIGTLFLRDAIRLKKTKPVEKIMREDVFYINEKQPLDVALHGFIKTRHHLFVVVNEFEDIVGVITIEDVIEQIIGHPIVDEDDGVDDMRAVAASKALQKRMAREPKNIV